MKKHKPSLNSIPIYWALLVGVFATLTQMITYYARFGRWNTQASLTEYLLFLLAGSLGGTILIFFLNRQTSPRGRWIVLIFFLVATPIALLMMLGGGLFGLLGVLTFPQIPWAFLTCIGSLLGSVRSRA